MDVLESHPKITRDVSKAGNILAPVPVKIHISAGTSLDEDPVSSVCLCVTQDPEPVVEGGWLAGQGGGGVSAWWGGC